MPYPPEKFKFSDIIFCTAVVLGALWIIVCFCLLVSFIVSPSPASFNKIENSKQWGGYSPVEIYTIFDKDTGVYYVVTETGDICPMYTIEGEVKLVDQGNEYVVHRNLGEPYAQE